MKRCCYSGILAFGILLSLLLQSCYCEKQVYGSYDARFLKTYKSRSFCHPIPCNGKFNMHTEINAIAGYAIVPETEFPKPYRNNPFTNTPFPQLGFRAYYRPSNLFQVGPLLGLGFEYSTGSFKTHYSINIEGKLVSAHASVQPHWFLPSVQFITFARPRVLGFVTFQFGLVLTNEDVTFRKNGVEHLKSIQFKHSASRIAYGFQFIATGNINLFGEIGIGGGAMGRFGLSYWF